MENRYWDTAIDLITELNTPFKGFYYNLKIEQLENGLSLYSFSKSNAQTDKIIMYEGYDYKKCFNSLEKEYYKVKNN